MWFRRQRKRGQLRGDEEEDEDEQSAEMKRQRLQAKGKGTAKLLKKMGEEFLFGTADEEKDPYAQSVCSGRGWGVFTLPIPLHPYVLHITLGRRTAHGLGSGSGRGRRTTRDGRADQENHADSIFSSRQSAAANSRPTIIIIRRQAIVAIDFACACCSHQAVHEQWRWKAQGS